MASHLAKTSKSLTKHTESNNGWTSNYPESDIRGGCGGQAKRRQAQSTPVVSSRQALSDRRRRPRGSEFFPKQFWRYVAKGSRSECWLWRGTVLKRNGYGTFWHPERKQMMLAHRFAWTLTKGEIPTGLKTLHKCDVPACCNPQHLWLGTQLDNMQDMAAKGRRSPDCHTPRGYKWTPEHRAAMMAARKRRTPMRKSA